MSNESTEIRKHLDVLKKVDVLKKEEKIKITEADATLGSVTVSADDTMLRILDLAGIARPAIEPGMEPGMGIEPSLNGPDMGMDVEPATPALGMDTDAGDIGGAPLGDPTDLPITPGMDSPDLGGMDVPDSSPVDMGMDTEPEMGMGTEPEMGMDTEPEMDMDTELPPTSGMDLPVGTDVEPNTDDATEVSFSMDNESAFEEDELDEGEKSLAGKRFDYGTVNPNLGQEEFDLQVSGFSGEASKPTQFVPARSGDNPMVDKSKGKGLKEYVKEISQEKKEITEGPLDHVQGAVAKATKGVVFNPAQQIAIDRGTDEVSDQPNRAFDGPGSDEDDAADDVLDRNRVTLNPVQRNQIERNMSEDEIEEAKRKYSFKQQVMPFQGLTGTQRIRRNALKQARARNRNR